MLRSIARQPLLHSEGAARGCEQREGEEEFQHVRPCSLVIAVEAGPFLGRTSALPAQSERNALIARVRDGLPDRSLGQDLKLLVVHPREEAVEHRASAGCAFARAPPDVHVHGVTVDLIQLRDETERDVRAVTVTRERFEEASSIVRTAASLHRSAAAGGRSPEAL
jgi:hypothetical protein